MVSPSNSISGRNDAGLALRDVGATSTTERGRNSFAWTHDTEPPTALLMPLAAGHPELVDVTRGTQALHQRRHIQHFLTVGLIGFERRDLLGERLTLL